MQRLIFLGFLALALTGCSGGSSVQGNTQVIAQDYRQGFAGTIQKGPLIYGSYVTVYLLDQNLNPTGQSYIAQTTDDLGNFTVSANISSNLVQMVATGYYMDELTGNLSSSPVTLNAYADLSLDATPTINVLTTLQSPRVKVLMARDKSMTYSSALEQSAKEVLSIFGIDSEKINGYKSLFGMQINGSNDQDAALLAASAVLAKMSANAAIAGSSQAAQLSFYLSRIASDIALTGKLSNTNIKNALMTAATQIDLSGVRSNVETYYADRGVSLSAPKFEEWIDKTRSGILPQRLAVTNGIFPNNNTDAEAFQVVTSNPMSTGIPEGSYNRVEVDSQSKVIINGVLQTGQFSQVRDGDQIQIQARSQSFGQTSTSTLKVGSTNAEWRVTVRKPIIKLHTDRFEQGYTCEYWSTNVQSGLPINQNWEEASKIAIPFSPSEDMVAKYLGLAINSSESYAGSVSVIEFTRGDPGSYGYDAFAVPDSSNPPLVISSSKKDYFKNQTLPYSIFNISQYDEGNISNFPGSFSFYLGSDGVALKKDKLYFVVIDSLSELKPINHTYNYLDDSRLQLGDTQNPWGGVARVRTWGNSVYIQPQGSDRWSPHYGNICIPGLWLTN